MLILFMCLQEIFNGYEAKLRKLRNEKKEIEKQLKSIQAEMKVCTYTHMHTQKHMNYITIAKLYRHALHLII